MFTDEDGNSERLMNGPNAAVQGRPYLLDLVDPCDASERRWQTDKEGRNGNKQAYGAFRRV